MFFLPIGDRINRVPLLKLFVEINIYCCLLEVFLALHLNKISRKYFLI